jgi:hypothetical protein
MGNLGLGLKTSVCSPLVHAHAFSLSLSAIQRANLLQSDTNLTSLSEFSGHHNLPNFLDFPGVLESAGVFHPPWS